MQISEISILKIDTEGHELAVLKGCIDYLKDRKIHVIQFERHSDDQRADKSKEIVHLLEDFGYTHRASIKHPFGLFYEEVYVSPELKFNK